MLKRFIAIVLCLCMMPVTASAAEFSDVAGHWAENEISYAVENGMVEGYGDGTFKPNNTVTRAEFVKMLVASIAKNYNAELPKSKSGTHWVSKYYSFAVAQGILMPQYGDELDGVQPGVLDTKTVDYQIKRWEMGYILYCVLANLTEQAKWYDGYADFEKTKQLYGEDMAYFIGACVKGELLKGNQNGNINAANNATRAEAITVVNRVDRMLKKK